MGHNRQTGGVKSLEDTGGGIQEGFEEAPLKPIEGAPGIPTAEQVPKAFDPITGAPISEALRQRPDPAAGKKLMEARAAEAAERAARAEQGLPAETPMRPGLPDVNPDFPAAQTGAAGEVRSGHSAEVRVGV